MEHKLKKGKLIIYTSPEGESEIEVKLENENIWLSLSDIAKLFDRDKSVISRHLKNVFSEGELEQSSVVAKNAITAADGKSYIVDFYNLDAILSVGYRVKSKVATNFRIWANKVLRDYLVQGFAINQKLIKQHEKNFRELQTVIGFINEKKKFELLDGQGNELIEIINEFTNSFSLLKQYDEDRIELVKKRKPVFELTYEKAKEIIESFRKEITQRGEGSTLLASEIDSKFQAVIGSAYQTFDGQDLYPTLEEKAANLLYLIIKDHPFSDGNKRIGSLLFIYFLEKNRYLYRESGEKKINDNALVALALLVAVSDPKDKDVIVKIITNLLS